MICSGKVKSYTINKVDQELQGAVLATRLHKTMKSQDCSLKRPFCSQAA